MVVQTEKREIKTAFRAAARLPEGVEIKVPRSGT